MISAGAPALSADGLGKRFRDRVASDDVSFEVVANVGRPSELRDRLLLGKLLAVVVPSIAIAYLVYGVFLVIVELFASPGVPSALIRGSDVLAQVIFTPLLASWASWLAIAISTRATDIRVAQQISVLASLPTVALTTLIAINVIHASLRLALAFGIALLVANRVAWRGVSALFDRERLITGPGA